MNTLYHLKVKSMNYIFDSVHLHSFKFPWWAPKDASFVQYSAVRPFKVNRGRWFWYQSKVQRAYGTSH